MPCYDENGNFIGGTFTTTDCVDFDAACAAAFGFTTIGCGFAALGAALTAPETLGFSELGAGLLCAGALTAVFDEAAETECCEAFGDVVHDCPSPDEA